MHEHDKDQAIEVEEVTCEVCLKNIPTAKAQSEKAADYIAYFCGLDCYNEWKHQQSSNKPDYNVNFLTGIFYLCESKYKQARNFFLIAVAESEPFEAHHDVYLSYLGLSDILIDNENGVLQHTDHSSDITLSIKPEIQLNLACKEFIKGNRKHSVQAIHHMDGLKLSAENSKAIHSFFNIVGKREQDKNGSLKRNKFIHNAIGKMFRKRESACTEQIEVFIRDTAKKRYKGVMNNILSRLK